MIRIIIGNILQKCYHPLKIHLLNIKLWSGHIYPFLASEIYPTAFSLVCFTETTSNGENLEILTVVKMIKNHFTNLPVMVLPYVIKPSRFSWQKDFLLYHPLRYYQFYLEQVIHMC